MSVLKGTRSPEAAEVRVGDTSVTIKRPGQSTVMVANILGRTRDSAGQDQVIWLDRPVHIGRGARDFIGWYATGAISTVLTRKVEEC